jgi:hypothetical protein
MPPSRKPVDTYTPPAGAELELLQRRELAVRATDAISEVLEADVSLRSLIALASQERKSDERLTARRAVRCVEAIARPNSTIVRAVGEKSLYHYVEGVIEYGASDSMYLSLMDEHEMDPEEVTSLYALRELIGEYNDQGRRPGFKALEGTLATLGISFKDAAGDPQGTLDKLDEAGYFVAFKGQSLTSKIIFSPKLAGSQDRLVLDDADGSITKGILEGQKAQMSRPFEEVDDEMETMSAERTIEEIRKNLNADEDY